MLKKLFSYINTNLLEEINNLPLFIPVFIGIGIGFYFHLEMEPRTWVVYSLFVLSALLLFFVNLGNSSDKFKHYKFVVAFSTFKYIFKKIFKIFLFTLLFPIIGHITLFILIGGWFISLLEYSYYLRYFAFFYDNSLMKGLIKFVKFLLKPIIKPVEKSKISSYSKNVIKVSKSKKNTSRKELKLLIKTTKNVVRFIANLFKKLLNNPIVNCFVYVKRKILKFFKRISKFTIKKVKKYVPENVLQNIWNTIYLSNFILFFVMLGVFVIKFRTNSLDTKLLQTKLKNQTIIARVVASEDFEDSYRLTLDNVSLIQNPNEKLDKIRIKFSKKFGMPEIGKTIKFNASLIPPFEPDTFGGFNFARYSYFKKLSASGRSFIQWEYEGNQIKNTFWEQKFFDFLNLRNDVNNLIKQKTSSDTSGVIMSMMTGERYSIPLEISENYKNAGISHLLAISGFHMTLIVGFAFFLIRFLFAFSVSFSNRFNTKKIASIFAFIVSVFYLFISGARLPTERAFIMSTLALIAIILDRNPVSLRFVSVSAIIILLFSPEALVNAGFQMSFIAVVSLIRLYTLKDSFFIKYDSDDSSFKKNCLKFCNMLLANSLTAFLIGIAIMPFVIYNFNSLQIYSVLGNFFAIPLFSFIVMPAILFAFLFMPIGCDGFFLKVVEVGVKTINYFAEKVAILPYSSISMKSMNLLPLLFIVFGLVWFLLWDRKWKKLGLIAVLCGIWIYIFSPQASIFANKYGNIFAINNENTLDIVNISKYKPSAMLIDNWSKDIGGKDIKFTDSKNFDISGVKIAIIDRFKDYKQACFKNNILFTTFDKTKSFFNCKKPVFDKRFFKYAKGAEFFINSSSSVKYKILRKYIGKRPWTIGIQEKDDENIFPEFLNTKLFNFTKHKN